MNKDLDAHCSPCGPCIFCGHHDKRHRLWDVMLERHDAGETAESIADDLSTTEAHVLAVIEARPYENDRKEVNND